MRILYPLEIYYPSQAGGTANAVYWLTKNLAKSGFESTVIATNKGITNQVATDRWLKVEAGRAIFVRTWSVHLPFRQTVLSLLNLRRTDIVHMSSLFYPAAFFTGFAAKLLGKKLALSPHGELLDFSLNHSAARKKPILWAIRKFIGTYALFHSTSDAETAKIKEFFGDKTEIVQIKNYLEVADHRPRNDGAYILYLGRIHPAKAIDNLIKALPLSEAFMKSGLTLKIAGGGKSTLRSELENLVRDLDLSEKVQFIGHVEGEAKDQLLADARFTILPSHNENFGVVVLESLAQGTPVIASRNTPWSDLDKEKIGTWVDNSPESLATAIDRMMRTNPTEYEDYRERSRTYVLDRFDMGQHIGEWVEFYDRLL